MRLLPAVLLALIATSSAPGQSSTISTFAAGAGPLAVDRAGNVFFVSGNTVLRWDAGTHALTRVAGNGTAGYSGDNGPAASAQLGTVSGLAVDVAGNLYIADGGNQRIRRVADGTITTIAGNGTAGYNSGDNGPAAGAQLGSVSSLAVDLAGNLYIADSGNQRIRKVANGVISTVAGSGIPGFSGDGGLAADARLNDPRSVALDSAGHLYIADAANQRIREVAGGIISTVAGNGMAGFSGDGGPANDASLANPEGVSVDGAGNLYIADAANHRIRKVANGVISTVAGDGIAGARGDNGPAASARLNSPVAVAAGSAGNLYIADSDRIRVVADTTSAGPANLSVLLSHAGTLALGQPISYRVSVLNAATAGPTSGTVTVTDTLPTGLTLAGMSGTGWNCSGASCTRSDALAPGGGYPAIIVAANVAANAPSSITNTVTVSGGGSPTSGADEGANFINGCSIDLSPTMVSLPPTGTSTVETCPNNSGQPNCGVTPETPLTITATLSPNCGTWTATSLNPIAAQVIAGAGGNGAGFSVAVRNNTHTSQQTYTITVGNASVSAPLTLIEAGSGNSQVYREVFALYESILGRDPDPAGFAFWTGSGGAGLGQMADSFLTSPEAFNSHFAAVAAYQAATGAPPTFAQFTAAVAAIADGVQTVPGIFSALAPNINYVTLFQNILDRPTNAGDAICIDDGTVPCFQEIIGFPSIVTPVGNPNNEFQDTGIYQTAPDHTNSLYIQMLYYLILGRDPDPSGLAFWTGIANSGSAGVLFQGNAGFGTRLQILGPGTPNQGFIGSPEFQGLFAN